MKKFAKLNENSYGTTGLKGMWPKIKLIRYLEDTYNISLHEPLINKDSNTVSFNDDMFKMIKTVFKTTQHKPKTKAEVVKLYASLVRSAVDRDAIKSTQLIQQVKKKKKYEYCLDTALFTYHLQLNKIRNCHLKNVNNKYIQMCCIQVEPEVDLEEDVQFI